MSVKNQNRMENSVDPDEMAHYEPSNLDLHCLQREKFWSTKLLICLFVCVEVLRPSQPNGVISSAVSLPNHTLLGRLSPPSG